MVEFTRTDSPTIMDGKVVRYKCGQFEINASRNGVSCSGFMPLVTTMEEFDIIGRYFSRAFTQYVHLSEVGGTVSESFFDQQDILETPQ